MTKPKGAMPLQADMFGVAREAGAAGRSLMAQRFIVPPFSVLDARQGYWQERKRAWLALGIKSELGRGEGVVPNGTTRTGERANGAWLTGIGNGDYSKAGAAVPNGTGDMTKGLMAMRGYDAVPGGAGAGSVDTSGSAWAGPRNGKRATGLLGFSEQAAEAGLNHYRNASNGNRTARTIGSGGPGTLDGQRKAWREESTQRPLYQSDGYVSTTGKAGRAYRLARESNGNGKATGTDARLSMGCPAHAYDDGGPGGEVSQSGTSIFDPVLCELVYRWFSPPAGHVLDPFAGGSVRGIVASVLGRAYTGVDLSERQITANRAQVPAICPDSAPTWIVGDSRGIGTLAGNERYDLIFSCPPYGDLEVYSDHPADLSTLGHDGFLAAYREIIAASVALLKPNRFACFVVGDIRDRAGFYRSLPADTVRAFEAAGARFYNEAVLVTAVGSLPIRVGKQFVGGRKLGRTHQNVLVFVKGDPKRAAAACELDMEVAGA